MQLRTIEELQSRSYKHLLQCTQSVLEIYLARGFEIEYLRGDNEFECLRESIRPTLLDIVAKNEVHQNNKGAHQSYSQRTTI